MMPPLHSKIYGTSTMNDKGQVVIPVEAREAFNIKPGARLMIMGAPFGDAVVVVKTEVIESRIQSRSSALSKPDTEKN